MTKKYYIIDRQFPDGCGWWTWTKKEPLSEREIKQLFREYARDDGIKLPKGNAFDFDFIQDLWECEIKEKKHRKERNEK